MLRSSLFVVCLLLNALVLLFFAVNLVIASADPILFYFSVEKDHSYFGCSVFTNVEVFTAYFVVFRRYIDTLHLACLVTESKNAIVTFR